MTDTLSTDTPPATHALNLWRDLDVSAPRTLLDLARGGAIGAVEIVPGVSGGTIALIIGVYETLIDSAGRVVRGAVYLAADGVRGRGLARTRQELADVRWGALVPLLVGMVLAVLIAARLLAPFVEDHPVEARALFAGLVVVSIAVPARMVGGRWTGLELLAAAATAVAAFVATSLPPATIDNPPLWAVAGAAAIAICALVMPGISGSFLLLAMGLYAPTLDAVNERDLGYIAVFAAGATVGLALFVQALRWLLLHRRRITLAVMTGAMVGSLRALWPWQDDDGTVLAPSAPVDRPVMFFVAGAIVVLAALVVEALVQRSRSED